MNPESTIVCNEIKKQNKKIEYTKLVCIISGKQHHYNSTIFSGLWSFAENIYNSNLSLKAAKIRQRNMEDMIRKLQYCRPSGEKCKTEKTSTFLNAKEFYKGKTWFLLHLEMFPLPKLYLSESDGKEDEIDSSEFLPKWSATLLPSFQRKEKTKTEEPKNTAGEFNRVIVKKEKKIDRRLFQKYFILKTSNQLSKALYHVDYKKENNVLVNTIRVHWVIKLEQWRETEKKSEEPDKIVDIVENIIEFNKQIQDEQPGTTDMSDLKIEESSEQRINQKGGGLKIPTPNQMLSRIPISLAQLKAENNSQKLKNEIRQLLCYLYCSKKLTKTIYNNLINAIQKWEQSLWTLKIVRLMNLNDLD